MGEDLVVKKAIIGEKYDGKTDHLYTPSLTRPCKKVVPIVRSFTKKKKKEGDNSMEVLFW